MQESSLIDPWGGLRDLRQGVLRHVTPAFREDPVRILRVARFAARLPTFHLAPDTLALMREMVQAGEADHLVPERVWQELARGLMAARPSRLLQVLQGCGAFDTLLPELQHPTPASGVSDTPADTLGARLDQAADQGAALPVRFACLASGCDAASLQALCERLRVPSDCHDLAQAVNRERAAILACTGGDAPALLALLERCDAFRRPERLTSILQACDILAAGQTARHSGPVGRRLTDALAAAVAVPVGAVAGQAQREGLGGAAIGERIRQARLTAVQAIL